MSVPSGLRSLYHKGYKTTEGFSNKCSFRFTAQKKGSTNTRVTKVPLEMPRTPTKAFSNRCPWEMQCFIIPATRIFSNTSVSCCYKFRRLQKRYTSDSLACFKCSWRRIMQNHRQRCKSTHGHSLQRLQHQVLRAFELLTVDKSRKNYC